MFLYVLYEYVYIKITDVYLYVIEMIMPSLNSNEYYCEVIKPKERKSIVSRRKFLLDLKRPMTDEESIEYDKLSFIILLQKKIVAHNKKVDKFHKSFYGDD